MAKIKSISAFQIINSQAIPTIQTRVVLSDGSTGESSVPTGESRGTYEAFDLRDMDPASYGGMGVSKAIENVNSVIAPKLIGMEAHEQPSIDRVMIELDGTQNKGRLGANAILSVSQAVLKAAAKSSLLPFPLYLREFLSKKDSPKGIPIPLFNMLEGGKHAGNMLNLQEFLVVPATSKTYQEGLDLGVKVYHTLQRLLRERNIALLNAMNGGFSADLVSNAEGLAILKNAIDESGISFSLDAFLGIDAAANTFKSGKEYKIKDKSSTYNQDDLVEYYETLFNEYALMYIEDPFAEDDWEGWKKIFAKLSAKSLIVGDDLTATNPYRLQLALDNNVINGIVIKPNQIGTVTECVAVIEIARYKNLKIIVSSRSGDTTDDFIADFAVGVGADYVKFGAPSRERIVKYNRLLEIQREMERF